MGQDESLLLHFAFLSLYRFWPFHIVDQVATASGLQARATDKGAGRDCDVQQNSSEERIFLLGGV